MKVIIKDNYEQMAQEGAKIILDVVKSNPNAVLGLATGSTPVGLYKELIKDHQENKTSYAGIKSINLDEYAGLPEGHKESYRTFMDENLFNSIDIDKANTNVPAGSGDLEQVAKEYEALIDSLGGADVQILGIGSNGHIAFNEPGYPLDSTTHVVKLDERTRQDNSRFFNSIDEVPTHAITMGIKSILKAKKIVLLANGRGKAAAVKGMIEGEITTDNPSTALQNHPDVTIILDNESASLLKK